MSKEIDHLIAEKVMGYRIIPPSIHEKSGFENMGYFVIKEETDELDSIWINQYEFSPSINIKDAWLVVEKLKNKVEFFNLDYEDNTWHCEFGREYSGACEVEADTAQMAICKASLKAIDFKL